MKTKSEFDALLAEIGELQTGTATMAKAAETSDDKKIEEAAAEGDESGAAEDQKDDDKDCTEGKEKPMAKSFSLKLEDGTEIEAMDAGELLKALTDRVEGNETLMLKAVQGLLGTVKGQGDLIKSLTDQVTALRGSGRGRKAVITVTEKPAADGGATLAKGGESDAPVMQPGEFLAKSVTAVAEGRITGREAAFLETCINRQEQPPAELVSRVLAGSK